MLANFVVKHPEAVYIDTENAADGDYILSMNVVMARTLMKLLFVVENSVFFQL